MTARFSEIGAVSLEDEKLKRFASKSHNLTE
jgi:hypothetical protein